MTSPRNSLGKHFTDLEGDSLAQSFAILYQGSLPLWSYVIVKYETDVENVHIGQIIDIRNIRTSSSSSNFTSEDNTSEFTPKYDQYEYYVEEIANSTSKKLNHDARVNTWVKFSDIIEELHYSRIGDLYRRVNEIVQLNKSSPVSASKLLMSELKNRVFRGIDRNHEKLKNRVILKKDEDLQKEEILKKEEIVKQEIVKQEFPREIDRAMSSIITLKKKEQKTINKPVKSKSNRKIQNNQTLLKLPSKNQIVQSGNFSDALVQMRTSMAMHSYSKNIESIYFSGDILSCWYYSPYPIEYHQSGSDENSKEPQLYICDQCLHYFPSIEFLNCHDCPYPIPPGADEVFRSTKNLVSLFKVCGEEYSDYCEKIVLLSKLFLEEKRVFDYHRSQNGVVRLFDFFVLVEWYGNLKCKFVGYFSREKHDKTKNLNFRTLSCVLVLPNNQRKGYGKVLIEQSYSIAQKEGKVGTAERPFSDLGRKVFQAFWAKSIINELGRIKRSEKSTSESHELNLSELSVKTGITIEDLVVVLAKAKLLLKLRNGKRMRSDSLLSNSSIVSNSSTRDTGVNVVLSIVDLSLLFRIAGIKFTKNWYMESY